MTENYAEKTRGLLELLNKLPPKPQITFRGYVDRTVDRVRVVGSPALTATTHRSFRGLPTSTSRRSPTSRTPTSSSTSPTSTTV